MLTALNTQLAQTLQFEIARTATARTRLGGRARRLRRVRPTFGPPAFASTAILRTWRPGSPARGS